MTIETKYNIGDEVWGRDFNKRGYFSTPIKMRIFCIQISIIDGDCRVDYRCAKLCNNDTILIGEQNLFPTKEELLKSL